MAPAKNSTLFTAKYIQENKFLFAINLFSQYNLYAIAVNLMLNLLVANKSEALFQNFNDQYKKLG